MTKNNAKSPYVTILFVEGKIKVSWGFFTALHKENDGGFSCYISAFDIYFSAKDRETINAKARALTRMYFNHFLSDKKTGLKHFVLELHKLGFKTLGGDFTMKQLLQNMHIDSKFKANVKVPEGFGMEDLIEQESNMSLQA